MSMVNEVSAPTLASASTTKNVLTSTAGREIPRWHYVIRFTKALICLLSVFGLWLAAIETRLGQVVDEYLMDSGARWNGYFHGVDQVILLVVSKYAIALVGVLAILVALMRRRLRLGLRALAVIGLTLLFSQLLKYQVFSRPNLALRYVLPNSYPSGHTAAAVAVSVALVMVVAPRFKLFFSVLGAAWTVLVGYATIINAWHRPADVLGAIFLAGAFALAFTPLEITVVPSPRARSFLGYYRRLGVIFFLLGSALVALVAYRTHLVLRAHENANYDAIFNILEMDTLPLPALSVGGVFLLICGVVMLILRAIAALAKEKVGTKVP
ncbi:phosphatase PAP2 family protein [Actinomycetaceae bacterium TAE3-ERU4]|nr:phosphatase PAP2 family protein [Actinomycetaceae bacterium TAE3-ERU4]